MKRFGRANVLWLCMITAVLVAVLYPWFNERALSQPASADDVLSSQKYERVNRILPAYLDQLGPARQRDVAYVKIGDIVGGSTARTHYQWIEAMYIGYGISPAAISRTGRISGKSDFSQLTLVKDVDQATPALGLACASGRRIDEVLIEFTQPLPERRAKYLRIVLKDVIVTSVMPLLISQPNGSIHVEEVSLHYGQITWEYIPFDEYGRPGAPIQGAWDIARDREIRPQL